MAERRSREFVPDHSWLSRTRSRLPLEVHDQVFTWVLERLAAHGLIKGERIGVDASTMEANAALRTIVRRDSGEGYREMLTRMARESGIETPTAEDLVRLDRNRKGKKLSNADWQSSTDPDARIAKLKDGRTHLAYKPEHAMDLDTGAVVTAEVHAADQGDTATMPDTLANAIEHLTAVDAAPTPEAPAELIADKGYHSRDALKALDGGPWKSRISEPHRDGYSLWHGDDAARRAVYNNRTRLLSGVARQAFKLRAELVERGFALILDRGGMRRVWLRGRDNVQKRYLIHVAGYNLGLLMRLLTGAGTPREFIAMALSSASCDLATRWRPDRHDIRRRRQSVRRIRRHDQTNPTRLNTHFLNGLLGRSVTPIPAFNHCSQLLQPVESGTLLRMQRRQRLHHHIAQPAMMLEQAVGTGSDLNDTITVRGGHTLADKRHACVRDHVGRQGAQGRVSESRLRRQGMIRIHQ